MVTTTSPEAKNTGKGGKPESPKSFMPTPERVSQFLERRTDEITTQLSSVDGRKKVYQDLLKHEDDLRKIYPGFNSKDLQKELDLVGETLAEKQKFMKDIQSPEKKGFFRRTWDRVKGFAKSHPVITTLLVVAASGAAIYFGLDLIKQGATLAYGAGSSLLERMSGGAGHFFPEMNLPAAPADLQPLPGIDLGRTG